MPQQLFELLRQYFHEYGYWTVAIALLLENAGIPLPGETTLLVAGFLAFSEHQLRLAYIILIAIGAATIGDNIGYWIGRRGGRPLLDKYRRFFHVNPAHLDRGERLMNRYGAPVVFFARFIFGLRVITGPLAGVLEMNWPRFALFNFLGAVLWVSVVASVGYFFGSRWKEVVPIFKSIDFLLLVLLAGAILLTWYKRRSGKSSAK